MGRCRRCDTYYKRHGVERPKHPTNRGRYSACVNCGASKIKSDGRCNACWVYFYKNGIERPRELWERCRQKAIAPAWCKNCGHPDVYCLFRCMNCYRYWRIHDKERPRYMWEDDPKCKTCGRPLRTVKRKDSGRCDACNSYRRKYGIERPQHFWGNGPAGWCDCGQPANHLIDKFPLCDSCAVEYKKGAYS